MKRLFSYCHITAAAAFIALVSAPYLAIGQAPSESLRQADSIYRAGIAALAHHDLNTAQTDFEQVVRMLPRAEPGHSALGLVLIDLGHLPEGVHQLELALSLKSTDSGAQLNLAMAYLQMGQAEKGLPLFAELEAEARTHNHPLTSSVLAAYARALAAAGKLDQASLKMQAAIQAEPRNAQLHDDLGSIEAQQKDWSSAQQEFSRAVQLDRQAAGPHLHLGLALQAQGQSGSIEELLKAQQLAPNNAIITLELGKAYAAAGQDDQAIPLFQQLLDRNPDAVDAMYELSLAFQRSNRTQEAIALLRKVLEAQPGNAIAAANLGMALTQAQRAKDAVPVLQHAIALAPDSVTAHEDLAAVYVQLNQFDDAETELHVALKLAPERPQLHYDLGLAYKMQDDATHAIPEFEAAEKLDPDQPEAPYALGLLYLQDGRYQDAARELKTSLTLRPENGEGWATLGSVYNQLNQLPEASAALLEAIRQVPLQPDPHLTLANVLIKQNKLDQATEQRKLAANLMRSNMNQQRAEVATHSGESLLKIGDLAGATVQFQDALSFDPTYAEAHQGLAQIYEAQGKPAAATAERAKAAQPQP
jgi:tetratricopeptide (TPR) repeat protein